MVRITLFYFELIGDEQIIWISDEYTRITTPRQDVLFKKGYLSRPKRMSAMEEGYLGAPLISQVPISVPVAQNGEPLDVNSETPLVVDGTENSAVLPTDVDLAITDDNSPLYFCPGFVDQNGYFHANRKCIK